MLIENKFGANLQLLKLIMSWSLQQVALWQLQVVQQLALPLLQHPLVHQQVLVLNFITNVLLHLYCRVISLSFFLGGPEKGRFMA